MTKQRAAELLPVIQAFVAGKSIQVDKNGDWVDVSEPEWYADLRYRVRPERDS